MSLWTKLHPVISRSILWTSFPFKGDFYSFLPAKELLRNYRSSHNFMNHVSWCQVLGEQGRRRFPARMSTPGRSLPLAACSPRSPCLQLHTPRGKIIPVKSHKMLIRLHMFTKHGIDPSVYRLIQNIAANIFNILADIFWWSKRKWLFYTIIRIQLKSYTIYCLNSLFLKYTSICILTPMGCIFWKALRMPEMAAFSLHI